MGSKHTTSIYDPASTETLKLSRSKIELYIDCPRCFYLDRRLGISRPSIPAFTLNSAVDHLLKKEFDSYRVKGEAHPLMKENSINAVPFSHNNMDTWRNNFKGVQYFHKSTNLLIYGAVDDVWEHNATHQLYVVDYKSTSTQDEITLAGKWKEAYKRQIEIYQWLMRHNGFDVSNTGYFVYANAKKDRDVFDGRLEFDMQILPYAGDSSWIEQTIIEIKKCLDSQNAPNPKEKCEYCQFISKSQAVPVTLAQK